ncbi:MAG: hypothetical protein U5K56_21225 [Halioglobus sp.]|nr:hypothetical protein [Halioglobus sp.]
MRPTTVLDLALARERNIPSGHCLMRDSSGKLDEAGRDLAEMAIALGDAATALP